MRLSALLSNPLRVYLVVIVLAVFGVIAGLGLPVSLYPNSSKPTVFVSIPYGNLNSQEFIAAYGNIIDSGLKGLGRDGLRIAKVSSDYSASNVSYQVEFDWGASPDVAKSEVEAYINSLSARWPREIREGANVNSWSRSSGFVAISFYSQTRTLDQLYQYLEPILIPKLARLKESENASLWNPGQKEIRIELNNRAITGLGLGVFDIERSLERGIQGQRGGVVRSGRTALNIESPRIINDIQSLKSLPITGVGKESVFLQDIASVSLRESSDSNRIFKTNGTKSLILFANPKVGGNIKSLAEEILEIVEQSSKNFPKDIQYKVLVDPSEFIRASISNVLHEVFMAAALAVFVLFLFVGSIRNTVTAAIEIPLSMISAFLLMKAFDMNLNLISLGGLALSAGMNVDASVVVMENILRNLRQFKGKLGYKDHFELIARSVAQVKTPIIASTLSTLVVFVPMILTQDLTNAILGDLAKAVVFSHMIAMVIALTLVPVIRLQLLSRYRDITQIPESPIEKYLIKLEDVYKNWLEFFIASKKFLFCSLAVFSLLGGLIFFKVIPGLKKEIIGTPDTDWMILSVSTSGNTLIKQMEDLSSEIEDRLLTELGPFIKYTFTQIRRPNQSTIMARLKDKSEMQVVWKKMEKSFSNTPTQFFWVGPWNPAELPLPDPPHMKLVVRGGNSEERMEVARELHRMIKAEDAFDRVWTSPDSRQKEIVRFTPHTSYLLQSRPGMTVSELTNMTRILTSGKRLQEIAIQGKTYPVQIVFKNKVESFEDLKAYPFNLDGRIYALKTLGKFERVSARPLTHREDGRDIVFVNGKQKKGNESHIDKGLVKIKNILNRFEKKNRAELKLEGSPSVEQVEAQVELNRAIDQLAMALGASVLLILLTLVFQFGKISHCLVIMTAIPLGTLGGFVSLWIFNSPLSLNAFLGIILLNGIAVNNSIILVDFILDKTNQGIPKKEAILSACRGRLRPILITSITTILGMLPVAAGLGEGGKILQPLGIAVTGGLWISMFFTLFLVPSIEYMILPTLASASIRSDSNSKKPRSLNSSEIQYVGYPSVKKEQVNVNSEDLQ